MRGSKRDLILDGALTLGQEIGFEALTFEALAEHVGLTRGGIVYHFATKQDLLEAIAVRLLESWRTEAERALGGPVGQADRAARIRALAISVIDGRILPGELAFILSGDPQARALARAWEELHREWVGDPAELSPHQRVALLALDGWWAHRATSGEDTAPCDQATRDLIIDMAAGGPEGPTLPSPLPAEGPRRGTMGP